MGEIKISGRLFQSFIHQLKGSLDRVCGVIDEEDTIVASSNLSMIGQKFNFGNVELGADNEFTVVGGFTMQPLASRNLNEFTVFVQGEDEVAKSYVSIISVALNTIKLNFDDKHDRNNFIKNIMLDNILPGDIYAKAKELKLNTDSSRVVFLIRFAKHNDFVPSEIIEKIFPDKEKDFITNINERDVALVKEVKEKISLKDLNKIGKEILDTMNSEFFASVSIGIGSVAKNIKDLSTSFKEAQLAIDVGRIFDDGKNILSYSNLGIGRIIYQLPTTLCEMFLKEAFKADAIEKLDSEIIFTSQKFFENSLNISETSRKLFVHRNTLVYRLDKIKKITGLDIREFDQAIIFKVALMVKRYLDTKK